MYIYIGILFPIVYINVDNGFNTQNIGFMELGHLDA